MANALFSYGDVRSAQAAARRAAACLPPSAVVLHANDPPASDSILDGTDEAITGGFTRNLFQLWHDAFEWSDLPHESSDYAEAVQRGGAVVSVDANTPDERREVDESLQGSGYEKRTGWKERTG